MAAIGSGSQPTYVDGNGAVQASTVTLGTDTKPLKMVNGVLQAVSKELATKEELTAVNKGTGDVIAKILGIDIKQNNYSLPLATASVRGGAKIGFTKDETNKKYPVELLNEQMFVQVPWQNTVYTLPAATTSTLGGVIVGDGLEVASGKLSVKSQGVSFDDIYPVGSVYVSIGSSLPASFTGHGTWEKIADGRTLWTTSDNSELGESLTGILPKHTHTYTKPNQVLSENCYSTTENLNSITQTDGVTTGVGSIDSSVSDVSIGTTLRPPSIGVSMWYRTA